jgi:hypothetical protein
MDLTTNSVSTADWIRATQNMAINTYNPDLNGDLNSIESKQRPGLVTPIPDPQLPLTLQE